MNAYVGNLIPDRAVWPRGLVGRQATATQPFTFNVGQLVAFDRNFWVVLGRTHSFAGREHYDIYNPFDEREHRTVIRSILDHPPLALDESARRRISAAYLSHLAHRAEEPGDEDDGKAAPPSDPI